MIKIIVNLRFIEDKKNDLRSKDFIIKIYPCSNFRVIDHHEMALNITLKQPHCQSRKSAILLKHGMQSQLIINKLFNS
jgi:hypothetical protein